MYTFGWPKFQLFIEFNILEVFVVFHFKYWELFSAHCLNYSTIPICHVAEHIVLDVLADFAASVLGRIFGLAITAKHLHLLLPL